MDDIPIVLDAVGAERRGRREHRRRHHGHDLRRRPPGSRRQPRARRLLRPVQRAPDLRFGAPVEDDPLGRSRSHDTPMGQGPDAQPVRARARSRTTGCAAPGRATSARPPARACTDATVRLHLRERRPRRPAGHPGADARDPSGRARPASASSTGATWPTHIPGAVYVELPGVDNLIWAGDQRRDHRRDPGVRDGHPTGADAAPRPRHGAVHRHRRLDPHARRSSATGAGGALLAEHDAIVRRQLDRFGGHEVKTDRRRIPRHVRWAGPGRPMRRRDPRRRRELGLDDPRRTPHRRDRASTATTSPAWPCTSAARIAALAGAGEVLVSSTVKDLVVGSGLEFDDRGSHELKGVPGEWNLFTVRI